MRAPILTFKRARNLRGSLTLPEVLLWQQLRGGRIAGLRFRRQHPLGPYILDFFCSAARLAIEIDGAVHGNAEQGGTISGEIDCFNARALKSCVSSDRNSR